MDPNSILLGLIFGFLVGGIAGMIYGYKRIETEAEARRYRNQLISRMRSLNERLSAVEIYDCTNEYKLRDSDLGVRSNFRQWSKHLIGN